MDLFSSELSQEHPPYKFVHECKKEETQIPKYLSPHRHIYTHTEQELKRSTRERERAERLGKGKERRRKV